MFDNIFIYNVKYTPTKTRLLDSVNNDLGTIIKVEYAKAKYYEGFIIFVNDSRSPAPVRYFIAALLKGDKIINV